MDSLNVNPESCLDELIREIVMMQAKICVTDVRCDCGIVHRVPLDGFHICQCGRKVMSQILTNMTDSIGSL